MNEGRIALHRLVHLLQKELRDLVRDRRVLLSGLFLPALLIPILLLLSGRALDMREDDGSRPRIGLAGDTTALRPLVNLCPEADWMLETGREALLTGRIDAMLERRISPSGASYRISFDGSSQVSLLAKDLLQHRLEFLFAEERRRRLEQRLGAEGAGPRFLLEDLGAESSSVRRRLPALLPMLLVLVLISSSAFAALDLFPGERERGTLETLLVQPLHRAEILLAKTLAVGLTGFSAVTVNLLSLQLCALIGLGGLSQELTPSSTLLLLIASAPLCMFLTALLVRLLARASTVREGQHLLLPLAMLALLPAFLAGMPALPWNTATACLPLLGPALALREVLVGNHDYLLLMLCLVASGTLSLILLEGGLAHLVRQDEGLLEQGPAPRRALGRVWLLVLLSMLGIYSLGPLFQGLPFVTRIALPQLIFVALPVLVLAPWAGISRRKLLSLHGHADPSLLLGLTTGIGILMLSSGLAAWQDGFLPMPSSYREASNRALSGNLPSWPVVLLVIGLLPALSEELLYRRLFLPRLVQRHGRFRALVLCSVMFAIHHLSLYRFVPSLAGGLALGLLVLATGRFWLAPLAHALSNSLAAILALPGAPLEGSELSTLLLSSELASTRISIGLCLVLLPLWPWVYERGGYLAHSIQTMRRSATSTSPAER